MCESPDVRDHVRPGVVEQRGVCYYHDTSNEPVDGHYPPILVRPHGGGMAVLRENQDYSQWGSAWTQYRRTVTYGPWERVGK